MRHRIVNCVLALLVGLSAGMISDEAGHASSAWSLLRTPNPPIHTAEIDGGLTCVPALCVAVGSYRGPSGSWRAVSERLVAGSWTVDPTPAVPGFTASWYYGVSCSSATACVAVGYTDNAHVRKPFAELWDGTGWVGTTVPAPARSRDTELHAVSCVSVSDCVAVGSYTHGGQTLALTEAWDGTVWSMTPAPATNGLSTDLDGVACVSETFCVAVGNATSHTTGYTNVLAESWDGLTWAIDTVPNVIGLLELRGVACSSVTSCTGVGYINNGGPSTQTLAERWDGARWVLEPTPNPAGAFGTYLASVACPATDDCLAAGYNEPGTGTRPVVSLIEHWDGSSWSMNTTQDPAVAINTLLTGIACTASDACLATGYYAPGGGGDGTAQLPMADAWDGQVWSLAKLPSPVGSLGATLNAVSCTAAGCVAVGMFDDAVGDDVPLIESTNGSRWIVNPTPPLTAGPYGQLWAVSCASAVSCMAVGDQSGAATTPLTEEWDGTGWTIQAAAPPPGSYGGSLESVSCASASECVAVGVYRAPTSFQLPLIERWDGTSWTVDVAAMPTGASEASFFGVSCPTTTFCLAVGQYSDPAGAHLLAESFGAAGWSVLPTVSPGPQPLFWAVSCTSDTACLAVGDFAGSGYGTALAEVWDGSAWAVQAVPVPSTAVLTELVGISCTSSACAAVGRSGDSAGNIAALTEEWDGTAWSVVPSPSPGGFSGAWLNSVSCFATCVGVGRANSETFAVVGP